MLPSLHPLQEHQEVQKVQIHPTTTKKKKSLPGGQIKTNTCAHAHFLPQNDSLCFLFHREARPGHQSLCLPEEEGKNGLVGESKIHISFEMRCIKAGQDVHDKLPWVQIVLACLWHHRIQDDPVKI